MGDDTRGRTVVVMLRGSLPTFGAADGDGYGYGSGDCEGDCEGDGYGSGYGADAVTV